MEKATKKQIEDWKAQYGDVFTLEVEDKVAYLKPPSRKVLSYATSVGVKDPMKFNETLLKECWIDGDVEIQEVDSYFMGASAVLAELLEFKTATIKKN
jgi:hypothetical protein